MEVLTHAGLQMLILFTVVLLGALARKLHLMNDAFDALLSKLVMTVALPGMILNSVLGNTNLPDSNTILMLLACSTVLYFFICLFAWVFVRVVYRGVPKPAQGAHAYLISFGNTGFIGFAVLGAIMGNDAVLYGAVYNIPYNVFYVLGWNVVYREHRNRRRGGQKAAKRTGEGYRQTTCESLSYQLLHCYVSCPIRRYRLGLYRSDV